MNPRAVVLQRRRLRVYLVVSGSPALRLASRSPDQPPASRVPSGLSRCRVLPSPPLARLLRVSGDSEPELVTRPWALRRSSRTRGCVSLRSQSKLRFSSFSAISFLRGRLINHDTLSNASTYPVETWSPPYVVVPSVAAGAQLTSSTTARRCSAGRSRSRPPRRAPPRCPGRRT